MNIKVGKNDQYLVSSSFMAYTIKMNITLKTMANLKAVKRLLSQCHRENLEFL